MNKEEMENKQLKEQNIRLKNKIKQLQQTIDYISNLIYELLNEYAIDYWEDIDYIELADYWVKLNKKTFKNNKMALGTGKLDGPEFDALIKTELKKYLINYKGE